ncbi:MAG: DUF87 domain-containing protein [Candidatus Nanoarchaeia archaeon]|nr:DUF87 domain-containing protein [Candidatus Nanoarchaeia archaeon]MDD5239692.1 DUF87 domain-containing protein [Candidatus Nanoarchaeia archaeon]
MQLVIGDGKSIDADKIVTGRTCIIGQSGSGKSYAVAVLCEELAKKNIGFCIIDTEGEYFSLKEKYPVLWVGSDPDADVDIANIDYKTFAHKIIEKGFPTIFDISEVNNPEEAVKSLLRELYTVETKDKKPFLVIIEEIDKFAPQKGKVLYEVEEISRRGRKRGLGLLVATQRPALVNKNILSQCANQIIGKLTIMNDLESVKIFFPDKEQLEKLPTIEPGYFFIQGGINPTGEMVKIRKRETTHKGTTPKLVQRSAIQSEDLKTLEVEIESKEIIEETFEEVKKQYVKPKISQEQAFEKIKKATSGFLFFGSESNITNLHLKLYPVYECQLRFLKKKMIGKELKEFYTYINALTGDMVSLDKGIRIQSETSQIADLSEQEIKVFKAVMNAKELSITEISFKTGMSETTVRSIIKVLLERNLVRSKKIGNALLYSSFTAFSMPDIKELKQNKVELIDEKISAELIKPKVDIRNVKIIINGINENSEIISKKEIYYPFYEAIVIKKDKKSKVEMDAVTGKMS